MYWDSPTMGKCREWPTLTLLFILFIRKTSANASTAENAFSYLRHQADISLEKRSAIAPDHIPNQHDEDEDDVFFDSLETPSPLTKVSTAIHLDRVPNNDTIMSFPASWSGRVGRLCISRVSISFVNSVRPLSPTSLDPRKSKSKSDSTSLCWERPLTELLEIRKTAQSSTKNKLQTVSTKKKSSVALSILWARRDEPGLATTEETPNDRNWCEEELLYGMNEDRRNEAFNTIIGLSGALWQELQPEAGEQYRMH